MAYLNMNIHEIYIKEEEIIKEEPFDTEEFLPDDHHENLLDADKIICDKEPKRRVSGNHEENGEEISEKFPSSSFSGNEMKISEAKTKLHKDFSKNLSKKTSKNVIQTNYNMNKINDIKIQSKLFKCSECDYETNRKDNLKLHFLNHSDLKLFKCSECDYETNHKGSLKRHSAKHSNIKLFKCSECEYETNHNGDLKVHLLNHSDLKLFKCSECDYETNHKRSLKIHAVKHSDLKLFKCSECNYEAKHKGSLTVHLLNHSDSKLFKCSECDYETNYKSNLKIHLLKHSRLTN